MPASDCYLLLSPLGPCLRALLLSPRCSDYTGCLFDGKNKMWLILRRIWIRPPEPSSPRGDEECRASFPAPERMYGHGYGAPQAQQYGMPQQQSIKCVCVCVLRVREFSVILDSFSTALPVACVRAKWGQAGSLGWHVGHDGVLERTCWLLRTRLPPPPASLTRVPLAQPVPPLRHGAQSRAATPLAPAGRLGRRDGLSPQRQQP